MKLLLGTLIVLILPLRVAVAETPAHVPSVDDLIDAQNELRSFAEYYIGRKPTVQDQIRADHAGDKVSAIFKTGTQSSAFVEALVSKLAGDVAFSEQENFKIIPDAPLLNLQRLMSDRLKAAQQLAIVQTYQQQRIIEQNERLIHLLEQAQKSK